MISGCITISLRSELFFQSDNHLGIIRPHKFHP